MLKRILTPNLKFYSTAVVGSTIGGVLISEYILTDDRLDSIKKGIFGEAHAFSTADHGMHAAHYPWEFDKFNKTFDHAALRRGYQVYREICAACHSMDLIYWRNLIGVTHTAKEVKEMAGEFEYKDGPDDTGEYFMRPGKTSDPMPRPYVNDEAARAANGGALPPDLSCISRARKGESV